MKILQVSASDTGGGAHKIARALHRGMQDRGHTSAMAVGKRTSRDPSVYALPRGIPQLKRVMYGGAARALRPIAMRVQAVRPLRRAFRSGRPLAYLSARRHGWEYFDFPGSHRLLETAPFEPDIVHLHNLHNDYFDLRYLSELSARVPVAMTLHDEWTFTGHCAYGMGCERWRLGCGECPDLTIYPAIAVDGTHDNWLTKRSIYGGSRLYVSAPSRWMVERARQSILAGGAVDFRHIPNGVDQEVFKPVDQRQARDLLGLPREPLILLFTANLMGKNPFKDYATVAAAADRIAQTLRDRSVLLIALGAETSSTVSENAELRFVPYEKQPTRVAAYYQAADAYLHAANADTFPTTILESLSAGRPVVATAVDGISEQVHSLAGVPGAWDGAADGPSTATGVLVPAHDPEAMAAATVALLRDDKLRARLGRNAAKDAAARYGLRRQLDTTVAWYREVIEDWRAWRASSA